MIEIEKEQRRYKIAELFVPKPESLEAYRFVPGCCWASEYVEEVAVCCEFWGVPIPKHIQQRLDQFAKQDDYPWKLRPAKATEQE